MFRPKTLLYAPDGDDAGGAEEFKARGSDVTPEGHDPDEAAAKASEDDGGGSADAEPDEIDADAEPSGDGGSDEGGDDAGQATEGSLSDLTDDDRKWAEFGRNQVKGYTPDEVYSLASEGHDAREARSKPAATPAPKRTAKDADDGEDDEPVTRKELNEAIALGHAAGQKEAAFDALVTAHPELNAKAQYSIKATAAALEKDYPDATPAQIAQTAYDNVVGGASRAAKQTADNDRQQHTKNKLLAKSNRNVPAGRSIAQRQTAHSKRQTELESNPNALEDGSILTQIMEDD